MCPLFNTPRGAPALVSRVSLSLSCLSLSLLVVLLGSLSLSHPLTHTCTRLENRAVCREYVEAYDIEYASDSDGGSSRRVALEHFGPFCTICRVARTRFGPKRPKRNSRRSAAPPLRGVPAPRAFSPILLVLVKSFNLARAGYKCHYMRIELPSRFIIAPCPH